jgi:hypothetical protein
MRDSFYICYEKLCRNIKRISRLTPEIFTDQMVYDFLSLMEDIDDNTFMFYDFREALYKLFLMVLNLLSKGSPFYVRASNYYYLKYLYRVDELPDTINPVTLDFVLKLTCELNDELKNRVRKLTSKSVIAEPIDLGEVIAEASNNVGQYPLAIKSSAIYTVARNVNPINYSRPHANFVLVNRNGNTRNRNRQNRQNRNTINRNAGQNRQNRNRMRSSQRVSNINLNEIVGTSF